MMDLKDISKSLGFTVREVRYRIKLLDGALDKYTQYGEGGKLLVKNSGFEILKRVREFEREDVSVSAAAERVKSELESSVTKSRQPAEDTELVQQLKARVHSLEEDKKFLQDRVTALENIIQNRVMGETSPDQSTDVKYLQRTIDDQREKIEELTAELERKEMPWWKRLFQI